MSLTSWPSSISARPPMMRRGARLHRHHARRQLGEERDQLAARQFARHNDLALRVDCVNLKHPLRQIETNPRDSRQIPNRLAHGRLPFRWGFEQRPPCPPDAVRGAAPPITPRRRGDISNRPVAAVGAKASGFETRKLAAMLAATSSDV